MAFMHVGQLVVANQCGLYGNRAAGWPGPALRGLHRRHEWLLYLVAKRIGFVPKDMFYPLGPQSKALLKPGRG